MLDSRSVAFANDIRRLRREGVDVVLNSLSGEAMERGLSTLRPFGRFVELGKRDYVANTRIGLRPFRRNLSYFGVDVDQLLSEGDRAAAIFAELMSLFEAGELKPLPYRVFSAGETLDAFRLMQQSGHVGKIVLRPPAAARAPASQGAFRFDPDRTHLVTGGFGGFGLEAARWLADRGVRHLVLAGRSGPQGEEAEALVRELLDRGVDLRARRCDVADAGALSTLLDEIATTMPPLAGVLHAAMVLEDGLVAGLTGDQLDRVLAPKVAGAAHLDRLTDDCPLDYFVLFSSITTMIGNPGQGAYVAANGYLEGLARLRRERDRPALAVAWGAISDVGVLARRKGLAEALSRRVGVKAMPAREALDLMAQALAATGRRPDRAVLAIGALDWSAARRLPALGSPTFAALVRDGGAASVDERDSLDLRTLVATEPEDLVRKRVIAVIVEEIASVLRIPQAEVGSGKRLAEIGLDSLMAIELATALQDRLHLDSPLSGSVGAMTPAALAEHLIGFVRAESPDEDIRVAQALKRPPRRGFARPGDARAPDGSRGCADPGSEGPHGLSEPGGGRLSAAEREALLARVARKRPGPARERETAATSPEATDFTTLPGFRELQAQRSFAAVLGLENPFFRVHEERAGPETRIGNRAYANFASYDYLGLNGHPEVSAAAKAAIDRYGTSTSASRLVAGERPIHRELERGLADILRRRRLRRLRQRARDQRRRDRPASRPAGSHRPRRTDPQQRRAGRAALRSRQALVRAQRPRCPGQRARDEPAPARARPRRRRGPLQHGWRRAGPAAPDRDQGPASGLADGR